MILKEFQDVSEFYAYTEGFLLTHEAENNLILGILSRLKIDPNRYGEPPVLLVVEHEEQIILVSIRTPPYNQILSYTHELQSINLLVDHLDANKAQLPGVLGFKKGTARFVDLWSKLSGNKAVLSMNERIYQLEMVNWDCMKDFRVHYGHESDKELIFAWAEAFNREAFHDITEEDLQKSMKRMKKTLDVGKILILYDHENQPVTMANKAAETPNGQFVNLVYTPRNLRRKGFATACVAQLSQDILNSGKKYCFLFTDLANPTSNSIYQKIGYRPVIDMDQYNFS